MHNDTWSWTLIIALVLWFASFGFYCLARLNHDWEDFKTEKVCSVGSLFLALGGVFLFSLDAFIKLGMFYP